MIATVIDLCNIALAKIGGGRIAALTEASNDAIYCNLLYEPTRDEVLRAHNWKCAREMQALAQLSETPEFGFSYYYQLPEDPECLRVLEVYPDSKYEIMGKKLASDEAELSVKYIQKMVDPTLFDSTLVEVIATRLGSLLATPVAAKPELATSLFSEYLGMLSLAKMLDGAQGPKDSEDTDTGDRHLWVNR